MLRAVHERVRTTHFGQGKPRTAVVLPHPSWESRAPEALAGTGALCGVCATQMARPTVRTPRLRAPFFSRKTLGA